jgi:hypothetical protein
MPEKKKKKINQKAKERKGKGRGRGEYLVNFAECHLFDTRVFAHFAKNTTITTSNDQDLIKKKNVCEKKRSQ